MRFITEFELSEKDNNDKGYRKVVLFNQKANRQIEMGEMLAGQHGSVVQIRKRSGEQSIDRVEE